MSLCVPAVDFRQKASDAFVGRRVALPSVRECQGGYGCCFVVVPLAVLVICPVGGGADSESCVQRKSAFCRVALVCGEITRLI